LHKEIDTVKDVVEDLGSRGEVSLAYLFGPASKEPGKTPSAMDIAVYIETADDEERVFAVEDAILSAAPDGCPVDLLRLDLEDTDPFVIQESLQGIPLLTNPSRQRYYEVAIRVLRKTEMIRHDEAIRRELESEP
jgi:hypothetical protein